MIKERTTTCEIECLRLQRIAAKQIDDYTFHGVQKSARRLTIMTWYNDEDEKVSNIQIIFFLPVVVVIF